MHRLYWQVYLSFVAILLLFGVLMSFAFFWVSSRDRRAVSALTTLAEAALPAASASDTEVQGALEQLQETLHLSLAVWGDGERIAATGVPLPAPDQSWTVSRVIPSRGRGFTVALRLSDGRWVVARHHRQVRAPGGVLAVLLLLGIAVALGAYPLVRRLTRRVERLQRQVEALGAGELGARVDVEGTYRAVVLRKNLSVERGEHRLFDDIVYFFYLTNKRDVPVEEIVWESNDRCNQENLIAQLKSGVHALEIPLDNLNSNWAYMVMASLAWNLKAWFGLLLPEKGRWASKYKTEKQAVIRMEFKSFVNAFIRVPAQIIRQGRKTIYRLLAWNPWQPVFLRGFDQIATIMRC